MLKVIILSLLLTACSWKDVLDFVSPSSGGIDTEVVLGDKREQIDTRVGSQEAEEIINNNNAPVWLIALAMLGWFMPTPQGMYNMWREKSGG